MRRKVPKTPFLTLITLLAAGAFLSAPAHAGGYLSGYSSSGSSSYLSGYGGNRGVHYYRPGSSARYLSKTGRGSTYTTTIVRQHQNEYARIRKAKQKEAERLEWYNQNPPCGIYNRMPNRCRRGHHLADQTFQRGY